MDTSHWIQWYEYNEYKEYNGMNSIYVKFKKMGQTNL